MTSILILGGGIAGMSTAMELMADHDVTILERRDIAGGKCRTWTDPDYNVFREHSFRVFHDTYHNTFDTMERVSIGGGRTIRDNLVRFVTREDLEATGENTFRRWLESSIEGDTVSTKEKVRVGRDALALLRALTSCDERLAARWGSATFEDVFAERPDGSHGLLFQGLKDMSQVEYSADRVNPDVKVMLNFVEKHFLHGTPGIQWNALVGPTSDTFIEPWKRHLQEGGVEFRHGMRVESIDYDAENHAIRSVTAWDNTTGASERLEADHYVSCLPSDDLLSIADKDLLIGAPSIAQLGEVRRVWNNGVLMFTSKPTRFLGGYYMWHPWRVALTTYAERWENQFDISGYGVGEEKGRIGDIISFVLTDWHTPSRRTGKTAAESTPQEIFEELCWMCLEDPTVLPDFDPAELVHPVDTDGNSVPCLVDAALHYDPEGKRIVVNEDTLAHLPPGYSFRMPGAATEIPNLALAGCHVYNAFGCGDSMEGANETGRRAANAVLTTEGSSRRAPVMEGRTKSRQVAVLEGLRRVDRALWGLGRKPASGIRP